MDPYLHELLAHMSLVQGCHDSEGFGIASDKAGGCSQRMLQPVVGRGNQSRAPSDPVDARRLEGAQMKEDKPEA